MNSLAKYRFNTEFFPTPLNSTTEDLRGRNVNMDVRAAIEMTLGRDVETDRTYNANLTNRKTRRVFVVV